MNIYIMAMKMHSEGFEQAAHNWIHGLQHLYDLNLSPFSGSVEDT